MLTIIYNQYVLSHLENTSIAYRRILVLLDFMRLHHYDVDHGCKKTEVVQRQMRETAARLFYGITAQNTVHNPPLVILIMTESSPWNSHYHESSFRSPYTYANFHSHKHSKSIPSTFILHLCPLSNYPLSYTLCSVTSRAVSSSTGSSPPFPVSLLPRL